MAEPAPLLQADGLTRHYAAGGGWRARGTVQALAGVSFTLQPGRTLAVVGESGCGKSTLARQVAMIETPTAGRLHLDGVAVHNADAATRRRLRSRVQMVFQNPYASLNPRHTVGASVAEPLVIQQRLPRAERDAAVAAMFARVGLRPEHAQRHPHMFSGGQRQRIAIARAMMLQPAVVVADEPTSALDVSVQAQILNLFMDLQADTGTAYLFISHNLAVVQHVADEVMVMYLGRAVEQAPKAALFAQPLHPYTQALLAATPVLRAADRRPVIPLQGELPSPLDPPAGCAFHPRCPRAEARCRTEAPVLRDVGGRQVACHLVA